MRDVPEFECLAWRLPADNSRRWAKTRSTPGASLHQAQLFLLQECRRRDIPEPERPVKAQGCDSLTIGKESNLLYAVLVIPFALVHRTTRGHVGER